MPLEYEFLLDTEEERTLLCFPLAEKHPRILSVRGKGDPLMVEVDLPEGVSVRGVSSSRINEYYHIEVSRSRMYGARIKDVIPLRTVLPEKESQEERKESKGLYGMNEREEQMENRRRNPNYTVKALEKEPWVRYALSDEPRAGLIEEKPTMPPGTRAEDRTKENERIRRTIYNARVVNTKELRAIHPHAQEGSIRQALTDLTEKVLGRYVLKAEYYNDLSQVYENLLRRIEKEGGALKLREKEVFECSERMIYILDQITDKKNHIYYLKGRNED